VTLRARTTELVRRRPKTTIGALVAVLALAALAVFVVHALRNRGLGIPAELVPPAWEQFKTSAGHRTHVEEHHIACKECHNYESEGFKNPGVAPCAKCHQKETAHTHDFDAKVGGDCLTCHAFAPTATPTCISCHANAQGPQAAIAGVHATTACTDCHTPHGRRTAPAVTRS
jgi:hypothetical protein